MNVLYVSHCDFHGNSALHVLALADQAAARGLSPAICVPDDVATFDDFGRRPYPVVGFEEAQEAAIPFPDGRRPDLVHAFTPREHVRRLTEAVVTRDGCRYLVHLEDNENVILADAIGASVVERIAALPPEEGDALVGGRRTHPVRAAAFLAGAAGVTAVVDTLLELGPKDVPAVVVWPGFDPAVLHLPQDVRQLRSRLRVSPDDFVLVYTGNIHASNLEEAQALYTAVALLRAAGRRVVLVKTGWNNVEMRWVRRLRVRRAVRDLGFVHRERVWEALAVADALVQPGSPGPFNDYRFPSKLPDFLASGKPVIMPRTNIGRYLRDGVHALLLERGDAEEIAAAVERVLADPELASRLGAAGRDFALRELSWSTTVEPLFELYEQMGRAARRA